MHFVVSEPAYGFSLVKDRLRLIFGRIDSVCVWPFSLELCLSYKNAEVFSRGIVCHPGCDTSIITFWSSSWIVDGVIDEFSRYQRR